MHADPPIRSRDAEGGGAVGVFSLLVTCYLFLGGAGGGALSVLSVRETASSVGIGLRAGSLSRGNGGSPGVRSSSGASVSPFLPRDVLARSWVICLALLALGVLCLAADLERLDRLLAFALSPTLSVITVGAWALVVAMVCAGVFFAASLFDGVWLGVAATSILGCMGVVAGVTVFAYTGVLLQGLASVLAWQTPLLPAVFSLSSLSCGVAAVFLGVVFSNTRQEFDRAIIVLARFDRVVIALEAMLLAVLAAWALGAEGTREAGMALAAGDLSWAFYGIVAVTGLALPFVLERYATVENYRLQLLWVAAAVLAGAFALRWCIVGMGAYDVTQMAEALFGLGLQFG